MKRLVQLFLLSILPFTAARAQEPHWVQARKIAPAEGSGTGLFNDGFGGSVSISGDYAIVGAQLEGVDVSPVDFWWRGAAYVYERDDNGSWGEVQKLTPSDSGRLMYIGASVSISGEDAFVGAHGHGTVYVYRRQTDGTWTEIQKLVPEGSEASTGGTYFGRSVCLSGDVAIVGAWAEHDYDSTGTQRANSGAAYIFERDGNGTWNLVQRIVASDRRGSDVFGSAVSISGSYAIVGAHNHPMDEAGQDSIRYAGAAYLFERNANGIWNQVQKIVGAERGPNYEFGISVSISGTYAIAGALVLGPISEDDNPLKGAGSADLFERDGSGRWNRVQTLVATDRETNDRFGQSVALNGQYAIVGAYEEDEDVSATDSLQGAGSAYVFRRDDNGAWNQVQKIVSEDRDVHDAFGWSVAIDGSNVIVGATGTGTSSIGGDPMHDSGSAYIFTLSSTTHVADTPSNDALSFHPNPVDQTLRIDLGRHHSEVNVTLRDILGRRLLKQSFAATDAIDIGMDVPTGIYLVEIHTSDGVSATVKILKK